MRSISSGRSRYNDGSSSSSSSSSRSKYPPQRKYPTQSPQTSREQYSLGDDDGGEEDEEEEVEEVEEEDDEEEEEAPYRNPVSGSSSRYSSELDPQLARRHQHQHHQQQFAPMEVTEESIDVDHRALEQAFARRLTTSGSSFIDQLCQMVARSSDSDIRRDKKDIVSALEMVGSFVGEGEARGSPSLSSPTLPPAPATVTATANTSAGAMPVPLPLYARVSLADLEDFGVPNGTSCILQCSAAQCRLCFMRCMCMCMCICMYGICTYLPSSLPPQSTSGASG